MLKQLYLAIALVVSCCLAQDMEMDNMDNMDMDMMKPNMQMVDFYFPGGGLCVMIETRKKVSMWTVTMRADSDIFKNKQWYMSVGLNDMPRMYGTDVVMCAPKMVQRYWLPIGSPTPQLLSAEDPMIGLMKSNVNMNDNGNITCTFSRTNMMMDIENYYNFNRASMPYVIASFGTTGYHGPNRGASDKQIMGPGAMNGMDGMDGMDGMGGMDGMDGMNGDMMGMIMGFMSACSMILMSILNFFGLSDMMGTMM